MEDLYIFAFTHHNVEINQIGLLHIEQDEQEERLLAFKEKFCLDELMFLSTCNRVGLVIRKKGGVIREDLAPYLQFLFPELSADQLESFSQKGEYYKGFECVQHLLKVTSSIDSMVVGEREIITQVRKAFDYCRSYKLTGDVIRLMIRHTIETAKRVYTETEIAKSPVSVVSLAYHTLKAKDVHLDARILIIGSGVTNTNMGRFLDKHGFTNFTIFNRTKSNAEFLAKHLKAKAYSLNELNEYKDGFDIIITCTGADSHIITSDIYKQLLQGDTTEKVVIDLAIPNDLDPEIAQNFPVDYISIENLQKVSNKNLEKRAKEIIHVEQIVEESLHRFKSMVREREVELAMRSVPEKVKAIRERAIRDVFAKDIENMDDQSKETVDKIISYLEKKYISMPMIMAKEILLKK